MPRDEAALADIAAFARRAMRHVAGRGIAAFSRDDATQDAVIRCLGVIGEAAGRLSECARAAHPEVPWAAIIGMRNRLVHEYGAIDAKQVFKTVTVDLPHLLDLLGPLPDDEEEAG
jgi:uncharacterized protein with HEPN domain